MEYLNVSTDRESDIPKRGLKHFTETGAVFEDGSEVHDIDLAVLATGFGVNVDILDVPGFKGSKCMKYL